MPSPYSCLIAINLLTTPPDVPVRPPLPADWSDLREALVSISIQWEILDQRETRYVFARIEDFDDNLELVRHRFRDLAGAPQISDCWRFPDHDSVNEFISFNRSYRHFLDGRQLVDQDRGTVFYATIHETDELFQVWDTLRDARCEYYFVTVRRQALARLRSMIGDSDYQVGQLPPCVPLWRFENE